MSDKDALVANAADEKQVKRAADIEKLNKKQEAADLRAVLNTDAGRRFLWRVLSHCRVFGTVMGSDPQETAYRAGQQDTGHALMAWIADADDEAMFRMMQEAGRRRRRQATENEASRIDSVTKKR